MWHWDQGRLSYFQFDALRAISQFALGHDFKQVTRQEALAGTGLPFAAPPTHSPWRNYSRILKLCLLVSEQGNIAVPTPVAQLLAAPGAVTCDEYLHFLVQASTEPNPALEAWSPTASFRYPLLFALKYLLATSALAGQNAAAASATLHEIIGAYRTSGFTGSESDTDFLSLLGSAAYCEAQGASAPDNLRRQAKESLKVLCQISYLHLRGERIFINLAAADAATVFADLHAIVGPRASDRNAEIRRLASLFAGGPTQDFFTFPNTVINDVVESGFTEGTKVQKTHVTIERNRGLRNAYFAEHPTSVCDVCNMDTHQSYPWTARVLDLHHLLPLCSGTRVENSGTTFADLVPLCPSCHRGVHRYYDDWFRQVNRKDFQSRDEAVNIYNNMKQQYPGPVHV